MWAPEQRLVDLVLERDAASPRPLQRDDQGYWGGAAGDVKPGDLYRYRLNGDLAQTFPDPASRFQPRGVHGPSEVIDPAGFAWTDAGWQPPHLADLVFYELHVGTFTDDGTFGGVADRLDHLATLGVSAIELMPIGDFPGERNWGYDVAAPFAPSRAYGRPDDLRRLVDAAHASGLSVFLDVVYNHSGPDGAYMNAFSPHYFTGGLGNPWGAGVNLDGPGAVEVRRFFIENALHWLDEYHVDGLRLDATHELTDRSDRHFLAELAAVVREHSGGRAQLIAEDDRNLAQLAQPATHQGFGMDAVWADDFHHQARVHTAHDDEGYYADYSGSTIDLARTLRDGWFYTGQVTRTSGRARGTEPTGLAPCQFVICIQNHDQIGNRADGARLTSDVDLPTFRALSTLLLMAPETPLLFMGQEWAASTPFLFFTDHHHELGAMVTEGRRREFSSFRAFTDPRRREDIPDPQDIRTFRRSRLAWGESEEPAHRRVLSLYRRLLALRRRLQPGHLQAWDFDARALDAHTVALTLPTAAVVVRLSGFGTVRFDAGAGPVILSTEEDGVAEDPRPIRVADHTVTFERPGAVVMSMPLALDRTITSKPSISDTGGRPHGHADH